LTTEKHKPKILLATTCRWLSAARLGMALAEAGFLVDAVCPNGHPLRETSVFSNVYLYGGLRPLRSFRFACEKSQPDLVAPCDELAALSLHKLYGSMNGNLKAGALRGLIERSMGAPSGYLTIESRHAFLSLARAEGVLIPDTMLLGSADDLDQWLSTHSLPAVLKADGTSGGEGVHIVSTTEQARHAFSTLHAPLASSVVLKRTIVDRDYNFLNSWVARTRRNVSIQTVVKGRDANIALLAWKGEVLASISVEVLQTARKKGPAAVVRLIEDDRLLAPAQKLVKKLGISGLCGLDFMLEDESGNPYLIEINARATQTCHLPLAQPHDIPGALYAALTGESPRGICSPIKGGVIALFPAAWQLDPQGEILRSSFHDVPWKEPSLVRTGVAPPSKINYENWLALKSRLAIWRGSSTREKDET
jgi:hypothetical protein